MKLTATVVLCTLVVLLQKMETPLAQVSITSSQPMNVSFRGHRSGKCVYRILLFSIAVPQNVAMELSWIPTRVNVSTSPSLSVPRVLLKWWTTTANAPAK